MKGSLRMAKILRRLAYEPPAEGPTELRLTVKGHVLVLPERVLAEIRSEVLAHHKVNLGRPAAERALLAALWRVRPADLDQERDEFEDLVTAYRGVRTVLCGLVADGRRPAGPDPIGRRGAAPATVRRHPVQRRV